MRIIFATTNEGKMREIRMIMADLGVEILSMKEAAVLTSWRMEIRSRRMQ